MTTELVSIPFRGDTIEVCERDGSYWFSIRRGCENLNLDFSTQLKKLKKQRWAVVGLITTTGPDGKRYETAMIRVDKLPMWLVTIDANRIKNLVIREKVIAYQNEAADVIAGHFMGRREPAPVTVKNRAWDERFIKTLADHNRELREGCPHGFTVISAAVPELLSIEAALGQHGLRTGDGDLPDGSLGQRWARKNRELGLAEPIGRVPLVIPSRNYLVGVLAYPHASQRAFNEFVRDEYLPQHLVSYLGNKPAFKHAGELVTAAAADTACKRLTGRPAALKPHLRRELAAGGLARA